MLCWAETDFTAHIKESLNQDNIKIRHEMTNIFGEGNLIHEFDLDRLPPKNILEQIKAHSRSLVCL
jgi:L-serine dehydratase